MLSTYSKFLYGFKVTSENYAIDLKEGSDAPVLASVSVGSYTATTICEAIETALNAVGGLTYVVSFNRSTRAFTISANGSFQFLSLSGASTGVGIYSTIGISAASDTTLASELVTSAAGTVYEPQFKLQDYVSPDDYQQAVDASINKSASGKIEVYQVGVEKFAEFNIRWITNRTIPLGHALKNNPTAKQDAQNFLQFAITKAPFEFMPDEDTPETFLTLILESTPVSSSGTGYKLDEQIEKNLPEIYETGKLKLRLIE